jgi:alpha-tubulin suppressor-like RCC1 family protein
MTILDEKKYPLFDEYLSYKSYGKLAPVCLKDIPYEVVQIAAGENFQMFLTNNGELYSCG